MTKAKNGRSIDEAIDECKRELQVRSRCYDKWIANGTLSNTDARDRGERLDAAVQFLEHFRDHAIESAQRPATRSLTDT